MRKRVMVVGAAFALVIGCGGNTPNQPPKAPPQPETTSAPAPTTPAPTSASKPNAGVMVSDDIKRACGIVDSTEQAPKFDYDSFELTTQEKDILAQVARCLTEGALKGKSVQLVGRADPRGEQEYNMNLGERRADTVQRYLAGLGVDRGRLGVTSRGELDASGHDEEGWRKDRRVDVRLAK